MTCVFDMILAILATFFLSILVLIFSTVAYIITQLANESDDVAADHLVVESQDLTPSASPAHLDIFPICDNPDHHHSSRSQPNSASSRGGVGADKSQSALESNTQAVLDLQNISIASDGTDQTTFDEIKDTYNEVADEQDAEQKQPRVPIVSPDESPVWSQPIEVQREFVSSQLGVAVTKQIFDEFDERDTKLGGNPLHWCKTRSTLDKMFKLGVPINSLNTKRETPLHMAVRRRKLPIVIGLACNGADLNSRNDLGETPLILAAKINDMYGTQALLVFDADIDAVDKFGQSARHHASVNCEKRSQSQAVKSSSAAAAAATVKSTTSKQGAESVMSRAHNASQSGVPSSPHLILAMLNEMQAARCPSVLQGISQYRKPSCERRNSNQGPEVKHATKLIKTFCPDGCAHSGTYDGESYSRWSHFDQESLYKRYIFSDIIHKHLDALRAKSSWLTWKIRRHRPVQSSKILCIDGGGMRGVIVTQILIELQKLLSKPIVSYFDWIGGTSVGAFIASSLCLGLPLKDLRRICFDVKDEVFNGPKPYQSRNLERALKKTLGSTTRLSAIKDRKLAIASVVADRDPCQLIIFRNYMSPREWLEAYGFHADSYECMSSNSKVFRRDQSGPSNVGMSSADVTAKVAMKMPFDLELQEQQLRASTELASNLHLDDTSDPMVWQCVRASAAAPFFFEPYGNYLDGGIIANNPTIDMMTEFFAREKLKDFLSKRCKNFTPLNNTKEQALHLQARRRLDLVVSLGTGRGRIIGRQAMIDVGRFASGFSTVFSPVELLKTIRAARDLFKKLMQQSCLTDDHLLDRAQAWCAAADAPYFRLNPPLTSIFSIDDKRDEQLIYAMWQTKLYMMAMAPQLRELVEMLEMQADPPK